MYCVGNASRVASVIQGWNINFDGAHRGITVDNFLYKVRVFTDTLLSGWQLVCDHIHMFLRDCALHLFWHYRKIAVNLGCTPFIEASIAQF